MLTDAQVADCARRFQAGARSKLTEDEIVSLIGFFEEALHAAVILGPPYGEFIPLLKVDKEILEELLFKKQAGYARFFNGITIENSLTITAPHDIVKESS